MTRWFGTDGIRGEANSAPLTPEFLVRLGQALGEFWSDAKEDRVAVGTDGRLSGDMVRESLSAGLMSRGMNVGRLGLVTTPALSYLTRENNVAGGVMISASHNVFSDNGIKCFQPTGEKFTEEQEAQVEAYLDSLPEREITGQAVGRQTQLDYQLKDYRSTVRKTELYSGHVVVDCANGAGSKVASVVLEEHVDTLTVLNDHPSGTNINEDAGSLHPDILSETIRNEGADIGFAFDGDGDRVIAVDSSGEVINGDVLMYMLASYFSENEALPENGIVITVMSNIGLRQALERRDIQYEVVGVGDRNVYQSMNKNGWRLGGEQSGHIIDREWLPTGDGLRTLISVLETLENTEKSLSEWNREIEVFPQVLHNINVPEKPPLDTLQRSGEEIDRVENELGSDGRVLVRYSGTEPVARIMLEGPDEGKLEDYARKIGETMNEEIKSRAGETA